MLIWVSADAPVAEIERQLRATSSTLGPAAAWGREQSVRDWVCSRRALRLNPVMGRIEEIAGAFAYERDGVAGRTVSAPREACGPELRALLYGAPASIREVELRTLPMHDSRWLKLAAKDAETLQACMKRIIHKGVFCHALWTELATGYLCFTGQLRDSYAALASDLAGDAGLTVGDAVPPRALELLKPVAPEVKTWPLLGARDALLLGDPWAVLVA